eukprot:Phypoly_transcript_02192.p1 GENE.Phypoly_transcript_02192~~Phypoly_transcript_02192.p1  ORF type:complete len:950 (+),score=214.97 Phypoly_transcript_02192:198-2852(+)
MNNGVGLNAVLASPDSLNKIALTLHCDNPKSKIMVLELLAALCLVGEEYHKMVTTALDNYREVYRERKPYVTLVDYLRENTHHSVKAASLGLINSLINCTEDMATRVNLRDHFKQMDLIKALRELRKTQSNRSELIMQIDVFDKEMKYDEDKIMEKLLDGKQETDPFVIIKNVMERIGSTPLFGNFITMLNLLAKFAVDVDADNDESMREFSFLEKLIKKVAMKKQGVNLGGDEELLAFVLEGSGMSGDKAIMLQQNMAEAKKRLRVKNQQLKEKDMIIAKLAQRLRNPNAASDEDAKTEEGKDGKKLREKKEEDKKKELPKIPEAKKEDAVADAEITTEMAAPPPPPGLNGAPPPPPPPGMKAPATPERNKRHPTIKMKGFQWTKLRTRQIQNTMWVKVKYDKYQSQLPYEEIETLFGAKVIEEKPKDTGAKKNVSVLDPRRAQNVGILLTKFKCSNDELRNAILTMNESVLDLETMNQLIKYVPTTDEITAIRTFIEAQNQKPEEERSTLGKPEEFFISLNSINKVAERMKMLHFKLQFPDKLYGAKPDVRTAFNALKQLRESPKMFGMMEMILILGNFINDGTFRGNASGYKIDALVKMADTKSNKTIAKSKFNLVHFLVQITESLRPDLLDFALEIEGVLKAATLSWATVTADLRELRAGITQMEKEISTIPNQGDEDRFAEVMESFVLVSSEELRDTENMVSEVDTEFSSMLKFFAAEDTKYQLEEFFAIFKTFTSLFENAKKDLDNERENAEKTAKRDADRKARLAALKDGKPLPGKGSSRSLKSLPSKVLDEEDLDKIVNEATEPTEENIEETFLDDMIAKVQDGKINSRVVEEDSDFEDDYDEEASNAQLVDARDLMKRLGMDIDAMSVVPGEADM